MSQSPGCFFNVAVLLDGCADLGQDLAAQKASIGVDIDSAIKHDKGP